MIVWMLTGFWHGAGWNFLFWGFYYGILLLVEKFLLGSRLEKLPRMLRWCYTMVLVMLGWVFFASPDLSAAWSYLRVLFGGIPGQNAVRLFSWLPLGLAGVLATTPLAKNIWKRLAASAGMPWLEALLCLTGLLLCTAGLVSGSYNPFLYFRF